MTGPGRASRRRFLLGAGTALTAVVAGCSALSDRLVGTAESSEPNYGAAALAKLAGRSPPAPPATFPVEIPRSMLERHRRRARELLDGVPENPTDEIPNGAVRAELRRERRDVAASVDEGLDRRSDRPRVERLGGWRADRVDAAEVRGLYRAATSDIDADALRTDRDRLRSELYGLLDDWEYAAPAPVTALVVHSEIEGLVGGARPALESPSPLPDDPTDDPVRASRAVRSVESARASLGDADRIQRRSRDGTAGATASYRPELVAAADRLRRTVSVTSQSVEPYLDADSRSAVYDRFDRDLTDVPAGILLDDALDAAERRRESVGETARYDGPASAVEASGDALAAVATLATVVDAVRAGKYETPSSVARLRTLAMQAADAVIVACDSDPSPLTARLIRPAVDALAEGYHELSSSDGDEPSVGRALASFAYARHYADAVPTVATRVASVLRDQS